MQQRRNTRDNRNIRDFIANEVANVENEAERIMRNDKRIPPTEWLLDDNDELLDEIEVDDIVTPLDETTEMSEELSREVSTLLSQIRDRLRQRAPVASITDTTSSYTESDSLSPDTYQTRGTSHSHRPREDYRPRGAAYHSRDDYRTHGAYHSRDDYRTRGAYHSRDAAREPKPCRNGEDCSIWQRLNRGNGRETDVQHCRLFSH